MRLATRRRSATATTSANCAEDRDNDGPKASRRPDDGPVGRVQPGAAAILAFASLIVLMVFTIASDNFSARQSDRDSPGDGRERWPSPRRSSSSRAASICRSAPWMTFCAVIAGVFLTYWGLPMPVGILAAIAARGLCGCKLIARR